MSIEITVPELGKIKKSAKDLVISTLMHKHPLNLTKITNSIKKTYAVSVTFQGVRKAVNQLIENKVILKEGKEYSLNKEWIMRLRDFAESLHESYFKQETKFRDIQAIGDDLKVYTFDNLIDTDQFLNQLIKRWFEKSPAGIYLQQCGHAYFTVGNLEEESRINETMKKLKITFYTLTGGNSLLDRWIGRYFKGQNFYYTTKRGHTERYSGIYNDYFFQYETPKEFTAEIDKIYSQSKDFATLDFVKLIELLRKNVEIKVIVMRNPMVAEQLRKNILSHFKSSAKTI